MNFIKQYLKKEKALKDVELYNKKALSITPNDYDHLLTDAAIFIIDKNKASVGVLQKILNIEYGRAYAIMDQLERVGIVSKEKGTYPRDILVTDKNTAIQMINNICNRIYVKPCDEVDSMNGHDFECFCADLLKKNGFSNVVVTQSSGDHGIDILAEKDDITYAIQCKCYSSNIGNAAVQQALAGKKFYQKDIAVVLTNQYFTPQAKDEARIFGVKLWDRDKLHDLIQKSNS